MKRSSLVERHCPIARASSDLIDGWTFVILRELMMGNCKFDGVQEQTGMNPRSLSTRLGVLVEQDILTKNSYSERPLRFEYHLTEKGLDLWPVITVLKSWGERWAQEWSEDEPPLRLFHGDDKHAFHPDISCRECGEAVTMFEVTAEISDEMSADRLTMKTLNGR